MKPDHLNNEELEKRIPGLAEAKQANQFNVPDRYFESLSADIIKKIDALPDLEKLNKANPFAVPGGYFDSLPTTIQQRIIDKKKRKSIFEEWASIAFRPKYALAFAAVIILFIFGIRFMMKPSVLPKEENEISLEEIQNSNYLAELDESVMVEILEQQNMAAGTTEDSSLEQYLMDNNVEVSQIEKQL